MHILIPYDDRFVAFDSTFQMSLEDNQSIDVRHIFQTVSSQSRDFLVDSLQTQQVCLVEYTKVQ